MVRSKLEPKGICIDVDYVPAKRATELFKQGHYVGEIGRIGSYSSVVGERAIKVNSAIVSINGVLISNDLSSKEELLHYKGNLGIIRGWNWMEGITKSFDIKNIYEAKSVNLLEKAYELGRVDSFLAPVELVKRASLSRKFKVIEMYNIELFIWLHHSQRSLENPFYKALTAN